MSDFFGLQVALSSLYAQRRGLEVTGNNVANANTEGYSRQRVGMESRGGQVTPAIHAVWTGAGAGVTVQGVERLRDQFLEARALQEHGSDADLRRSQAVLARIELVFAEPSDIGLQAQLSDFWAGWDDIANRPDDLAARSQMLERSQTLADGFNQAAADVGSLWGSSVEQLRVTVEQANATAARVADLNAAIERATRAGLSPNDLADQRDRLVLELARSLGALTQAGDAGVVDVYVGGTPLVQGGRAETLALDIGTGVDVTTAASQPVAVRWSKDGYPASVTRGEASSLLSTVNEVLPRYRAGLDGVAQQLASAVNDQHQAGYDLDGNPGQPLFLWSPVDGLRLDIVDPARLAAAAEPPPPPSLDGGNALALAELGTQANSADQTYRSLIVGLGVETQTVNRRVEIQAGITRQVDMAREAEAGVNLDEELVNMVAYQRAYEASSRYLTAVDQLIDVLINSTGVVGR